MLTSLFWMLVGIVGAALAANKARELMTEPARSEPANWDQLGATARLGAARDVGQHYARLTAAVVVAGFCLLLAISGFTLAASAVIAWAAELV